MTTALDRRNRLSEIESHLAQIRVRAARTLWEYGQLLAEVQRDELWRESGAESFWRWAETVEGAPRGGVARAILVAQHFSADEAERWGSYKLASTVRYLVATSREERPGDVHALKFRVRGDDGTFRSVPFAKASYREIDAARKLIVRDVEETDDTGDLADRLRKLSDALPTAPKGMVRGERVSYQKAADGRVMLTFSAVPLDDLEGFLARVREHLLQS